MCIYLVAWCRGGREDQAGGDGRRVLQRDIEHAEQVLETEARKSTGSR